MPTPTSTDERLAESRGTPGGRPIIARRSVGPARIFLTREFSSLRIKSALNPPQTPALAAARAHQTPAPKITPAVPAASVSTEPAAESTPAPAPAEQATATTSGYEPIEEATADTIEPTTPSASLQLRATPPPTPSAPRQSDDEPARAEAVATAEASVATAHAAEEKPTSVSAPSEELPTVAAGALGSESEVETAESPAPAPAETPVATATVEAPREETPEPAATPAPATEVPAYAAVEPALPAGEAERPASHADETETPPTPTAGLMETPRQAASETESAAERVEPVDIAPVPAMLPAVSSSSSATGGSDFGEREPIAAGFGDSGAVTPETTHSTVKPSPSSFFPMTSAPTSSGERAIAQLTFSFEVASLQLTPAFRLGSVQLRPLTNVVTLHLNQGEGQGGGASPLSANIAFEILQTQTGGSSGHGPIQALVLKPLSEARAATTPQPKLAVNAVQLSQGAEGSAPIQITPAQNTSTSVQVLATFAIAGIDFTPLFEIGSMRLEPTTANVLLKLSQGAGAGGMELPPSFVLTDVEVGGDGQISSMLLVPRAA